MGKKQSDNTIHKYTFCCILALLAHLTLKAQQSTVNWLQRDFCQTGLKGMAPSRGISFERSIIPEYHLASDSPEDEIGDASSDVEHQSVLKAKLRAPLWNSDGFKAVIGFKYQKEEIKFDDPEELEYSLYKNINNLNMKVMGTDLIMLKPFRGNKYVVVRGAINYSGAFKKLSETNSNFLNWNVSALFGIRKNENTEMGFGVNYSNSLNVKSVYPVMLYNHNFNEKWGIEALLPKRAALRYNFNEKSLAVLVSELDGSRYYIPDVELSANRVEDLRMEVSEIKFGLSYQRQIFSILWMSVDAGYRKNIGFDFNRYFSGSNRDTIVKSQIPGGMYGGITLFLTPPKRNN
ncbi:MAG: hypothetical protein CMO01_01255 [Thalassobius sp.]|nr:hypothetical protein [Thalassovita sp.]